MPRTLLYGMLTAGLAGLLMAPMVAQAGPASYDDGSRRMVVACVDPQIGGVTATRKKDGLPKTHTLTFQFSSNYQQASIIAGTRVDKTSACTTIFNLATGLVTGLVDIDGEILDVVLQYTSGLSFNVVDFPLPMVANGAQTSLWRVINGTHEVYVGGVVNYSLSDFFPLAFTRPGRDILRESDFPLPDGFEEAYSLADVLIMRATPVQIAAAAIAMQGLSLNTQSNLRTDLGDELYDQVSDYFTDSLNLDLSGLPFRPHWIADLMRWLTAFNHGYVGGVQDYFENKASTDGKIIFALEEADDQMFALNLNMIDADRKERVTAALAEVTGDDFDANANALLDAWRTGDDAYIDNLLVEPDRVDLNDFKRFYTDRYANWLNVFEDMLDSDQQEFVLMDVRYLVGVDSFLVYLEEAGYTVERY